MAQLDGNNRGQSPIKSLCMYHESGTGTLYRGEVHYVQFLGAYRYQSPFSFCPFVNTREGNAVRRSNEHCLGANKVRSMLMLFLHPCRDGEQRGLCTGGVASLDHRLLAFSPPGCDWNKGKCLKFRPPDPVGVFI